MLLHFAPGAPREGYFEGLPGLAGLSEEERAGFFLRHDTFWTQHGPARGLPGGAEQR